VLQASHISNVAERHVPERSENSAGERMHALATRLYPICRSITGQGVRDSLEIIREYIPLQIREVASGTSAFDWVVPKEWHIRDAYVANADGERVIDFRRHNLHVVQYSGPVRTWMTLDQLRPRLHTLSEHPDWIPYRTSFYTEDSWGFCLTQRQLDRMVPGEYQVVIDASLQDGSLTYGEMFLPGQSDDEVFFHTHICHPSLANDNLSGMVVATFLASRLTAASRRYSYRFVFLPGTIGPLAWLALNEERTKRIRHGLVLTGVGDSGALTYKRSRQGNASIDRAMQHLLTHDSGGGSVRDFDPYGYAERQYCSPGFNLPVGVLMRTPHGTYPQYHTSGDDLEFLKASSLEHTLEITSELVHLLETNRTCRNLSPKGEPQLGKRGLYGAMGGGGVAQQQMAMLWVLNLADGSHSLLDIASRAALPYRAVERAAADLEKADLLESIWESSSGVECS
jgi:aminopeptidase-like protein